MRLQSARIVIELVNAGDGARRRRLLLFLIVPRVVAVPLVMGVHL